METTALFIHPRPVYKQRPVFNMLCILFAAAWVWFFATARDTQDWWIENILVIFFLFGLVWSQKRFSFSDTSLVFIFLF